MPSSRLRIPPFLVLLIVAIAVANGLADKYFWYWKMRWFDIPMHFAGGVWLAGMAFWWFYYRKAITDKSFSKIFTICLFATLGVGLVWEIYEAVVSLLTVGHINAMSDTIKDLSFDVIGGMAVTIWGWNKMKQKHN